jgi:hypothetical protein
MERDKEFEEFCTPIILQAFKWYFDSVFNFPNILNNENEKETNKTQAE